MLITCVGVLWYKRVKKKAEELHVNLVPFSSTTCDWYHDFELSVWRIIGCDWMLVGERNFLRSFHKNVLFYSSEPINRTFTQEIESQLQTLCNTVSSLKRECLLDMDSRWRSSGWCYFSQALHWSSRTAELRDDQENDCEKKGNPLLEKSFGPFKFFRVYWRLYHESISEYVLLNALAISSANEKRFKSFL